MSAAHQQVATEPDVSVVMPTYNRAASVRHALDAVLAQRTRHPYELIVVDNNSTDGTRAEVERMISVASVTVRCILEPRQGVSNARNAGIGIARAPIIAFVDDDVRVGPEWIDTICNVFARHPEHSCIGGKVLPLWEGMPPRWLTEDHWAPIALLDFGDTPLALSRQDKRCLLTANMACRREIFERVGLFRPELQRVKGSIGSMEDYEWLLRFWDAGGEALYVPELRAWTEVPASRMTREYHRRWHAGHGHYFALLQDPDFERSRKIRVFGAPAHAYRAALFHAWRWLDRIVRRDAVGAFVHETRLRFFSSYLRTRAASYARASPAQPPAALRH